MQIEKRNGQLENFNKQKIVNAIKKAYKEVGIESNETPSIVADMIEATTAKERKVKNVEDIQNEVELYLMSIEPIVAQAYIRYRYKRELVRQSNTTDKEIFELLENKNNYWEKENSNKNSKIVTVQRDYMAGITSTDLSKRFLLPKDVVEAHEKGILHFHDLDYFAQKTLSNCSLVNLEDMLQNGTVINGVKIEKPHRILTAVTIATQIITAVSSSQYGGVTITLTHLAPFVRESYRRYIQQYLKWGCDINQANKLAEKAIAKEVSDAVQTFNYQCNSMTNTNGQAPFLSVCMYLGETKEYKKELAMLIEEFLKQRILGVKNEVGVYVTPAFPKLLYVLEEDNIHEGSPYFYLTKLAAKCTAKRMVPDYISEKKMLEYKIDKNGEGNCYPCMGCRSFLTPYVDPTTNEKKYYGRFNQGVVTISLPDVALSSHGDFKRFWDIFDERLELCHKALQCRHERLHGTLSDVAPILWQHGAFARLKKGESIDNLLHGGYSTISLGYAGLYECVKYMTNFSHTHEEGKAFALKVMEFMNDKCKLWKEQENIDYSLYGSPIESTTYRFAKKLKERFGIVDGITDRDYITNSYHVPVFEPIDPFTKLSLESEFQALSPGGAISYIECADLTNNIEVVIEIIQFIYENIMYAELNCKSDFCQKCHYEGEIKIIDENNNLVWECPNCGNRDTSTMNVTRRTCGYVGTNYWNEGRTQEIKERYVHVDDINL